MYIRVCVCNVHRERQRERQREMERDRLKYSAWALKSHHKQVRMGAEFSS